MVVWFCSIKQSFKDLIFLEDMCWSGIEKVQPQISNARTPTNVPKKMHTQSQAILRRKKFRLQRNLMSLKTLKGD